MRHSRRNWLVIAMVALAGVLGLALAVGCDEGDAYYNSDCIGADGYNWCLPGSWSGTEIHEPTVTPMDFSPYGYD